jgi:hypothetical protein
MTSKDMKLALLTYFLWERGFTYGATEVTILGGKFLADVLVMDQSQIITEVEIKISKSDLKNDRKNKEAKFDAYEHPERHSNKAICTNFNRNFSYYVLPNRFYYAVPLAMVDEAKQYVKRPYGLLAVKRLTWNYTDGTPAYYVITKKRGNYIHKEKPTLEQILRLVKRLSTENIKLRAK